MSLRNDASAYTCILHNGKSTFRQLQIQIDVMRVNTQTASSSSGLVQSALMSSEGRAKLLYHTAANDEPKQQSAR